MVLTDDLVYGRLSGGFSPKNGSFSRLGTLPYMSSTTIRDTCKFLSRIQLISKSSSSSPNGLIICSATCIYIHTTKILFYNKLIQKCQLPLKATMFKDGSHHGTWYAFLIKNLKEFKYCTIIKKLVLTITQTKQSSLNNIPPEYVT